jgi:hypothetical protein
MRRSTVLSLPLQLVFPAGANIINSVTRRLKKCPIFENFGQFNSTSHQYVIQKQAYREKL